MEREAGKKYVLSISYGKDSLACLEAIKQLGYPLDRIVHAEVWATDTIQADLPDMVEFKDKADKIIEDRYGIKVERFCAIKQGEKDTYEKEFYRVRKGGRLKGQITGFPFLKGAWCNGYLKMGAVKRINGTAKGDISYIGIASDETERIERHRKRKNVIMPLVDIGWDEAYCRKWCEQNNLLSPIYQTFSRGGCWFCHNQGIEQLRTLKKVYPDLWRLMLKWDTDSPVKFKADGHTVHDIDARLAIEEDVNPKKWRWSFLDYPPMKQYSLFNMEEFKG